MIETPSTVNVLKKHSDGFYDRLENLMLCCGYRRHGLLTAIANISTLTVAGARLLKTQDRPPRENHLAALIARITKDINDLGKGTVTQVEVQAYLMDNADIAIIASLAKSRAEHRITIDYATPVIMLILKAIEAKKLDVGENEKYEVIELVVNRILRYCAENNPELDSHDLSLTIESMVSMASSAAGRSILFSK
ncbi:MAG: hypothetical protein EOO52_13500 [Gammaproteobacteria bacterium]|nr:MAG: hypothetical protein EOO52_13500 [Gammaproteobacteria bacterium]